MAGPLREASGVRTSRVLHGALIVCLLAAIGFRVYGYFAWTAQDAQSADASSEADLTRWHDAASRGVAADDWNLVVDACEKILAKDPSSVRAWSRLAYGQHQLGRYDQAIAAYLHVCREEGRFRQWAKCNIAACYARKHARQPDRDFKPIALDYLREAVEAGFRQRAEETPIAEDPDFASLADDSEFQRLAELTKPISQRTVYRQLDFLLGRWFLDSPEGRPVGSAEFAEASGQYAIVGRCSDNTRATESTFLAYYNPKTSHWEQTWVNDQGSVTHLTGEPSLGESWTFEGETTLSDGRCYQAQLTIDHAADGTIRLALRSSRDGGDRWADVLDVHLRADESSSASEDGRPASRAPSPR